jgi:WD40 repeat protein
MTKTPQELMAKVSQINRVYFSPSGQYISASHGSSGMVTIWDSVTRKSIATFEAQKGWCNAALFTADENTIISTGYGGSIKIWDWTIPKLKSSFTIEGAGNLYDLCMNQAKDRIAAIVTYPDGHTDRGWAARLSIFVWSFPNLDLLMEWKLSEENDLAEGDFTNYEVILELSSDGERVGVAASERHTAPGKVMVRKVSPEAIPNVVFEEPGVLVKDIQFSANFSRIAIALGRMTVIKDITGSTSDDPIKILDHSLTCRRMKIGGGPGLESRTDWADGAEGRRTLKEYLLARGAVFTSTGRLTASKAQREKTTKSKASSKPRAALKK